MLNSLYCYPVCFLFFFFNRFSFFLFCILGCTGSSLLHRLSLDVMSKGYSSFWCSGFLLPWFLLLWSTGCRCEGFGSCSLQNLEHSLSKLWQTGLVAPQHAESSQTKDLARVSCIGSRILIHCATREVLSSLFYTIG